MTLFKSWQSKESLTTSHPQCVPTWSLPGSIFVCRCWETPLPNRLSSTVCSLGDFVLEDGQLVDLGLALFSNGIILWEPKATAHHPVLGARVWGTTDVLIDWWAALLFGAFHLPAGKAAQAITEVAPWWEWHGGPRTSLSMGAPGCHTSLCHLFWEPHSSSGMNFVLALSRLRCSSEDSLFFPVFCHLSFQFCEFTLKTSSHELDFLNCSGAIEDSINSLSGHVTFQRLHGSLRFLGAL